MLIINWLLIIYEVDEEKVNNFQIYRIQVLL